MDIKQIKRRSSYGIKIERFPRDTMNAEILRRGLDRTLVADRVNAAGVRP